MQRVSSTHEYTQLLILRAVSSTNILNDLYDSGSVETLLMIQDTLIYFQCHASLDTCIIFSPLSTEGVREGIKDQLMPRNIGDFEYLLINEPFLPFCNGHQTKRFLYFNLKKIQVGKQGKCHF